MILDKINNPSDVKKLTIKEKKQLAEELRVFLVDTVSKTGGHLASNLGVVELTIALLSCFDFEKDKVVFDVGHQSYVYKILTGRKKDFLKLRKYKGIRGFPYRRESKYDFFETGHSSTSISAGLGMARARDLKKEKYNIITYGIENESDYMAENIISKEDGSIYTLKGTNQKIEVPVGGNHFVQNSLCALAVGSIYKMPIEKMVKGIYEFELTKKRMDITTFKNNITVINDYYNANYDSMKAAIEYLSKMTAKRKIAVLGDMLELGNDSMFYHKDLGKYIKDKDIDKVYTYGDESKYIGYTCNKISNHYTDKELLVKDLKEELTKDVVIYFKASRGIKLEEIIDKL